MLFLITILISSLNAQEVIRGKTVSATDSMIVTRHYLATEVGNDVLMDGGNAIDAAVAISFALAVVLPQAGTLVVEVFWFITIRTKILFTQLIIVNRLQENHMNLCLSEMAK